MKVALLLFCILGSPLKSFAYPKTGDRAFYEGFYKGAPYSEQKENLGYDNDKGVWVVLTEVKIDHETVSRGHTYQRDLPSPATVKQLLADCEKQGGAREITTVKAGKFETCKFIKPTGTTWYGDVPFGVIKYINGTGLSKQISRIN